MKKLFIFFLIFLTTYSYANENNYDELGQLLPQHTVAIGFINSPNHILKKVDQSKYPLTYAKLSKTCKEKWQFDLLDASTYDKAGIDIDKPCGMALMIKRGPTKSLSLIVANAFFIGIKDKQKLFHFVQKNIAKQKAKLKITPSHQYFVLETHPFWVGEEGKNKWLPQCIVTIKDNYFIAYGVGSDVIAKDSKQSGQPIEGLDIEQQFAQDILASKTTLASRAYYKKTLTKFTTSDALVYFDLQLILKIVGKELAEVPDQYEELSLEQKKFLLNVFTKLNLSPYSYSLSFGDKFTIDSYQCYTNPDQHGLYSTNPYQDLLSMLPPSPIFCYILNVDWDKSISVAKKMIEPLFAMPDASIKSTKELKTEIEKFIAKEYKVQVDIQQVSNVLTGTFGMFGYDKVEKANKDKSEFIFAIGIKNSKQAQQIIDKVIHQLKDTLPKIEATVIEGYPAFFAPTPKDQEGYGLVIMDHYCLMTSKETCMAILKNQYAVNNVATNVSSQLKTKIAANLSCGEFRIDTIWQQIPPFLKGQGPYSKTMDHMQSAFWYTVSEPEGLYSSFSLSADQNLLQTIFSAWESTLKSVHRCIRDLESEDAEKRMQAIDTIIELGDNAEEAIPAIIKALRDPQPEMQEKAIKALRKMGKQAEPAIPTFIEFLKGDNESLSMEAGYALRDIGDKAIEPLLKLLKDPKTSIREKALEVFNKMYPPPKKITSGLIEVLINDEQKLQKRAIEALGEIGPEAKDAVPHLVKHIGSEILGNNCTVALGKIGTKEANDALVKALQDKNSEVRARAARSFSYMESVPKAVIPMLVAIIKDENETLNPKTAAADTLVGTKEVEEYLADFLQLVKSSNPSTRSRVIYILSEKGQQVDKLVPIFIDALTKDEYYGVRMAAAQALGHLNKKAESAIPALITALNDEDSSVVSEALSALGKFGPKAKAAIPHIEKLKENKDLYISEYMIDGVLDSIRGK